MECIRQAGPILTLALIVYLASAVMMWRAIGLIRNAVLGQLLLEACSGDRASALLAIDTARQTTELMTHADPRVRRRWFTRDP